MDLHDSQTYRNDLDEAIAHSIGIQKLKGASVLVTGATGTIGSFVADLLIRYSMISETNITVYVAGRSITKLESQYSTFGKNRVKCLNYDVNQKIDFDIPLDYIVHAAGNAHPSAFNGDPVGTIVGNIMGTYNLLEYARHHGAKRLLYISSGEVYGQGDLNLDEFEESYAGYLNSTSPRSCYPESKRATENLCASYSKQYNLETVIVRPCHTYGPRITETDSRANAQFIKNALKNEDIVMKSAGTQMRSYNYIADCASAIITVLLNGSSGEAYNTANPESRVTISQLAQIIAGAVGKKVIYANPDAVDLANRTPIAKQVLSSKKIEALGWTGAYSVETGIKHTLDILQGK